MNDRLEASGAPGFDDFYASWRDPLRRALALATGDLAVADEAVDEAMTRAFTHWAKISSYERTAGWVYKVGLNWARRLYRKRRYEVLTQIDTEGHRDHPMPDLDVVAAVGRLSPRLRPVVVARYYLDWSTAQVAAALDISEGTVKSRLSRALDRLAADLGETR